MMEPFVALMRRYTIDYTNSHDLAVCDEIMEPGYVVHISGLSLVRDTTYKPAVEMVFGRFPGLGLAIHEILTNGDRLAMRFSEHAATEQGALACWAGIALYRWNGAKLLECRPDALEPPHLDPWTTTRGLAADRDAERVVGDWLRVGELGRTAAGRIDDTDVAKFAPILEATERVDIHDLFSAGPRVAFHASIVGRYRGGFADADEHGGKAARLDLAGIAMVAAGEVAEVRIVTDRLGTASRLTGRALF